jgi:hypothetical protein
VGLEALYSSVGAIALERKGEKIKKKCIFFFNFLLAAGWRKCKGW